MLHGVEIDSRGNFVEVKKAETISEVQHRTRELKKRLMNYNAHPYVIKCCREELLEENYFHAVLEASKSLLDHIREISAFRRTEPNWLIWLWVVKNQLSPESLRTQSEQNQQNGLREMINGVVHMVRNVTAHELKIRWAIKR